MTQVVNASPMRRRRAPLDVCIPTLPCHNLALLQASVTWPGANVELRIVRAAALGARESSQGRQSERATPGRLVLTDISHAEAGTMNGKSTQWSDSQLMPEKPSRAHKSLSCYVTRHAAPKFQNHSELR
ncbi:hypothetical protein CLCR_06430 [Cladophialophora carrionii]|uniref:Uncharacterized protein n=1 Tax=Cladophialophora carrionii TaxID=86049 RepID=A0A1C1C733_9EURO|nr:hypothetical protein CLCR_06430 [Cladophialophora carrionii]